MRPARQAAATTSAAAATTSAAAAAWLAGCAGSQSVLDPRGPGAERIADLWWALLALAVLVSAAVTLLLALALRRARSRERGAESGPIDGRWLVLGGGVIFPVVSLFAILTYSYRVGNDVFLADDGPPALTVEVVGHQFWWEVRYPEHGVATANEIHLPAGVPVLLRVTSPDVIHSFWVPQLHGKIDMVPGQMHTLRVQATEPGRFRGQCAELCGTSHALMALWVEALPPAEFAAWVAQRRAAAAAADPPGVARGRRIFFAAGCGDCHATRGAPLPPVVGTVGPDLSSLASRSTLAAGTLPNEREALARWIRDPQRIKPGVRMPATRLHDDDLETLIRYLETLR